MKRSMFGTLPLVAAALLISCGDPTGSLHTGGTVRVTPGFLNITVNSAESVLVQLIDDQGNALPATFSAASNNAAVATVGENVNFRPGLGENRLAGRFGITAQSLIDSTSVTFTAGGRSIAVPVLVAPTSIPLTLSPAVPNVNDLVTVDAPGFKFHPNTAIIFGGFSQLVTAVAADSSTVTFRAGNAGTGKLTIQNVALGYLPAIPNSFDSELAETFGPGVTPLTGTDALATAPLVMVPAGTTPFSLTDDGTTNDSVDCGNGPQGLPCRIYRLVLTEARDFDVVSSWNNDSDMGIFFALPDNSDAGSGAACDQHGARGVPPTAATPGANFESCTVSLTPGTYYMQFVTFAPFYSPPNDVDPTSVTITLTGH